ncbi:WD40 repeat domain-containing serine/threonine protein kinase [Streptomyces sp. NPDC057889]|uniref:WD40 repeat domain-containing serine/threonine protein kinase n=1 Tax=unclassified Streptomyces TaxID=2593676 RepID=UPI0036886286
MDQLIAGDPSFIGPYRLIARLGAGGMGLVYLGRSEEGRTVAVKVIRAEYVGHPEFRERFAREVAAARQVGGDWTAAVLDAAPEADVPWVATQYIPGPDLGTVVRQDFGPLPEYSVRVLANRLALALQAVHGAGLIHRDLKPSNVLVTFDGPRVIDFGIARAMDSLAGDSSPLTRTGMLIGSPGFMSPEQARGRELTPASDVFCLGTVLVYATTGRLLFGATDPNLNAHLFRIAEDEADLTGVPQALVDLVRQCVHKTPTERPTLQQVIERTATNRVAGWLPKALVEQLGRRAAELLDYAPAPRTQTPPEPPRPLLPSHPGHTATAPAGSDPNGSVSHPRPDLPAKETQSIPDAQTTGQRPPEKQLPVPALHEADTQTVTPDAPSPEASPAAGSPAAGARTAAPAGGRGVNRRSILLGGTAALAAAAGASLLALRHDADHTPAPHSDTSPRMHPSPSRPGPQLWFTLTGVGDVASVAFSPDGKILAIGSGDISFASLITRKITGATNSPYSVGDSVAFSPDGKILASGGGDGAVRFWDPATRATTATLADQSKGLSAPPPVAFSPHGRILAAGYTDGTVHLWDIATRTSTTNLNCSDDTGLASVAFSPDGKTLAANIADGTILLWDIATRTKTTLVNSLTSTANSVAFSPDGKTLAGSGFGPVLLWDIATCTHATLAHSASVVSVAFSPDAKTLATAGGTDDVTQIWDIATRTHTATLTGQTNAVQSVAFSRDGNTLAAGSADGTTQVWKMPR